MSVGKMKTSLLQSIGNSNVMCRSNVQHGYRPPTPVPKLEHDTPSNARLTAASNDSSHLYISTVFLRLQKKSFRSSNLS